MDENNEIKTGIKKTKSLPVPLSKRAKLNLVALQGAYQVKYKRKINIKNLGTKIFENATVSVL